MAYEVIYFRKEDFAYDDMRILVRFMYVLRELKLFDYVTGIVSDDPTSMTAVMHRASNSYYF